MKETFLQNTYPCGIYDHPGIASSFASRELVLREHILTSLYWFGGRDPLSEDMLVRGQVVSSDASREAYMKHYRIWGQRMAQARLEGMAVPVGAGDYILPDRGIVPPNHHYPTIALDFIAQYYAPGVVTGWLAFDQDPANGDAAHFHNKATVRARETVCLLGVFMESIMHVKEYANYTLFLERAIFAVMALIPVIRLGMPEPFVEFARSSVRSLAGYFYQEEAKLRQELTGMPAHHFSDLMECLGELANMIPHLGGYTPEACA
jgi:hypothetical protein